MQITIDWQDDGVDCETCGGGSADGGVVYVDGVLVVDMAPVAACYDGVSYTRDTVLHALFVHFNLEALFSAITSEAHGYSCDDEYIKVLCELGHEVVVTQTSLYEPFDYDEDD